MENINQLIISLYESGLSIRQTAKELNISVDKVRYILKKFNINTKRTLSDYKCYRKHNINIEYFKKIDTEAKSYFLGLLAADGCVYKNRITITLQNQDNSILYKFEKELKIDINDNCSLTKEKEKYTELIVTCKNMKEDLTNLGIVQGKSLILKPPTKIPKELIRHFVRGYFDGDGSIWFDKNANSYRCQIVTTFEMGEFFQNFFEINVKLRPTHSLNICRYGFSGNQNIKNKLGKIYLDSNFYIKRKYQKYLDCVNMKI